MTDKENQNNGNENKLIFGNPNVPKLSVDNLLNFSVNASSELSEFQDGLLKMQVHSENFRAMAMKTIANLESDARLCFSYLNRCAQVIRALEARVNTESIPDIKIDQMISEIDDFLQENHICQTILKKKQV